MSKKKKIKERGISAGDMVKSKLGGPTMVVSSEHYYQGSDGGGKWAYRCRWRHSLTGEFCSDDFFAPELERVG